MSRRCPDCGGPAHTAVDGPGTPLEVIAGELDGAEDERLVWAAGILDALTEHGYTVASTLEPTHEETP